MPLGEKSSFPDEPLERQEVWKVVYFSDFGTKEANAIAKLKIKWQVNCGLSL